MDIDLSQITRSVNSGPMIVYEPESVDTAHTELRFDKPTAPKAVVAKAIRTATNPAVAKRTIDAKIVQIATRNRMRAERLMRALGVSFKARSATMSGFWTWLTGTGKLSDLSKYSPETREQLKDFLKADTLRAIEKTYSQEELDAIIKKMRAGAKSPAGALGLDDPYTSAAKEYQAAVTSSLAPLGAQATNVGAAAAKKVGETLVSYYGKDEEAPTRSYDWLKHMKWVVLATVAGVGGYVAWPHIKPAFENGTSKVAQRLNSLKNMFGAEK